MCFGAVANANMITAAAATHGIDATIVLRRGPAWIDLSPENVEVHWSRDEVLRGSSALL